MTNGFLTASPSGSRRPSSGPCTLEFGFWGLDLGASWDDLRLTWGYFGQSCVILGPSWGYLERSRGLLGISWGHLGVILEEHGGYLGPRPPC